MNCRISTGLMTLGMGGLIVGLLAVTPLSSSAEEGRMQTPRAKRTHTVKEQQAKPLGHGVIRLDGKIQAAGKLGMQVDGTTVRFSGSTVVYPSPDGSVPESHVLRGQRATVFGKRTHRGIEAHLIILKKNNSVRSTLAGLNDRRFQVPSQSNSKVGELTEDADE